MPCKCEEDEKVHPWFSICVQQMIRATCLEEVMTTQSPLRARQILLKRVAGTTKATRICMSQSIHSYTHSTAVSNLALVAWLMASWPGPDPETPCVKK